MPQHPNPTDLPHPDRDREREPDWRPHDPHRRTRPTAAELHEDGVAAKVEPAAGDCAACAEVVAACGDGYLCARHAAAALKRSAVHGPKCADCKGAGHLTIGKLDVLCGRCRGKGVRS
jgi:hypothetical protein